MKYIDKVWIVLKKAEPVFFVLLILANAIPVLFCRYFPTVDGPAHLYNANIISELLTNGNGFMSNFYQFNNILTPNVTGHFLLFGLMNIFPAHIAEKIVLLIYIIGLPLSLRHIFKSIGNKNLIILYLIFPFTYSFLLYYGSFNFNIAIVLLLFGLSYNIRFRNKTKLKWVIVNLIFSTLISFSHVFVFSLYLFFLFSENIFYYLNIYIKTKEAPKENIIKFALLFISSVPGLFLVINYINVSPANDAIAIFLSSSEIFRNITKISPLVSINFGRASFLSSWMFILIFVLLSYQFGIFTYRSIKNKKIKLNFSYWLLISSICLLLLFILPDSLGVETGFIISRFIIFFFIILFIYLGSKEINRWLALIIFINIIFINISFISNNYNSTRESCELAKEIEIASQYIDSETIVYPITITDNYLFGHISNYLGLENPIVITDNYEAELTDFPIVWNYTKIPYLMFGDYLVANYDQTKHAYNKNIAKINYVIIINTTNDAIVKRLDNNTISVLKEDYRLIYTNDNASIILYRLKMV